MDKTIKRGLAGAAVAGAALIGGAFFVLQERKTEEPDFRALKTDGDFQIRDYPAMIPNPALSAALRGPCTTVSATVIAG